MLLHNRTVDDVGLRAIARQDGRVAEPNPLDVCAVGDVLLKVLIWGEPTTVLKGWKSLRRSSGMLVFTEQAMALCSPTFVLGLNSAFAHLSYMQMLFNMERVAIPAIEAVPAGQEEPKEAKRLFRQFLLRGGRALVDDSESEHLKAA